MAMGASDHLVFDASMDWADQEVMQANYGVTAAQAARSGRAAYNASAGVRRYGVGALWPHSFTPQWFSTVGVGVYRLGSDAANRPITVKNTTTLVSAGVGYRF